MEEIEGVGVRDVAHRLGEGVVLRGAPLEDEVPRCEINFLDKTIPDHAVSLVAEGCEVGGDHFVNAYQSRPLGGDAEFVQVAVEVVGSAKLVDFAVGVVELFFFISM